MSPQGAHPAPLNAIQRFGATLQGQPKDRPALLLNASLYGARLTGASLQDHYTRAAIFVEGQKAVHERFQTDFLLSPFYAPALGAAWSSELAFGNTTPPVIRRYGVSNVGDFLHLNQPDVSVLPELVYLQECLQGLSTYSKGQIPVVGLMVSPVDLPALIMGSEAWLDALLFEPELAQKALDHSKRFCLDLANAFARCGAMALCMTCNFANPGMLPWAKAKKLVEGFLRDTLHAFPCPVVLHHGGFTLNAALREGEFLYQGLPKVAGFYLDGSDDALLLRQTLGSGPLLLGNVEGAVLERMNPGGIHKLVHHWFSKMGADPQAVFATSGPDIPFNTPPENLDALRQALQEAVCHG